MKHAKPVTLLLCGLLLAGCSDLDRWTGFDNMPSPEAESAPVPQPQAYAPAAPAPLAAQQPTSNPFCQSVAVQDATGKGFDPATQQRVVQRSYAQCSAVFGVR